MKLSPTARQAIANRWSGERCYLNGTLAKVTGRLSDFATIATLDPSGPIVEFAWATVDKIMRTEDKNFRA